MRKSSKLMSPLFFVLGLLIISFCFFQSAGSGLRQYESMHLQSVFREIRGQIRARTLVLESLASRFESDSSLAEAASMAFNGGKTKRLSVLLSNLRQKQSLDFAGMMDLVSGRVYPTARINLPQVNSMSRAGGIGFFRVGDDLHVLSYSPVFLFGNVESMLLLGFSLNSTVAKHILESARTRVAFSENISDKDSRSVRQEILELSGKDARKSQIFLRSDVGFVSQVRLRSEVLFLVALGFALVLLSFLLFWLQKGAFDHAKGYAQAADEVLHDLRGPSHALKELLVVYEEKPSPEVYRIIRSRVDRIHSITQTLLHRKKKYESLFDHQSSLDSVERFVIGPRINALVREFESRYPKSKFQVECSDSVNQLELVLAPAVFDRLLGNLFDNASQAIVTAPSQVIEILVLEVGDCVEIRVSDSGLGIPDHILPHVFDRYYSHGKEGGSGIGLAYVKTTVDQLGGSVKIVSTEGFGTTVSLSIPKHVRDANGAEHG